jgi:hypothetical protein
MSFVNDINSSVKHQMKIDGQHGMHYVPAYQTAYPHHYGESGMYSHSFNNMSAAELMDLNETETTMMAPPMAHLGDHMPAMVPHPPHVHLPPAAPAHPVAAHGGFHPTPAYAYSMPAAQPSYHPTTTDTHPGSLTTQTKPAAAEEHHMVDSHWDAEVSPSHLAGTYGGPFVDPYGQFQRPFQPYAYWTGKKYKYIDPLKMEEKMWKQPWKYHYGNEGKGTHSWTDSPGFGPSFEQ